MLLFRHQYHVSVYAKLLIKWQISTKAFIVSAIIYVEATKYKGMARMLYMDCSEFALNYRRLAQNTGRVQKQLFLLFLHIFMQMSIFS